MFNVEVKLPSGKKRRIRELKNRDYLTIVKFCENKDLQGLNLFFEELYFDEELDLFDRFYLLIYVRMLFINENLTFTTEEQKNVELSLDTVLVKIEQSYLDLETTFTDGELKVVVGLPTSLYFEDIDTLFISLIRQININQKTIDFKHLTSQEKLQILNQLPTSIFLNMQSYIRNITNSLQQITVIEENKTFNIDELKLTLIGNGIMHFITSIYSISLKHFYELIYIFYQRITNGSDIFYDISPVESKILLNIHNATIEKENEELKKQK